MSFVPPSYPSAYPWSKFYHWEEQCRPSCGIPFSFQMQKWRAGQLHDLQSFWLLAQLSMRNEVFVHWTPSEKQGWCSVRGCATPLSVQSSESQRTFTEDVSALGLSRVCKQGPRHLPFKKFSCWGFTFIKYVYLFPPNSKSYFII